MPHFCSNLASLYESQGLHSKAEILHIEAKDIRAQRLGKKHIDYATSCNNLASLYVVQSHYPKAKSLFLEAKNIRAQVLGKNHPGYASSCNNLAEWYRIQGQYTKAELLFIEAKNIYAQVLGKKHSDYARSCNNLAGLYRTQNKYRQAESLCLEAKNIRAQTLGEKHLEYAASCNDLALLYMTQGLYSKAEPLYLEAKGIRAQALGKRHPDYATSCNNLALLHEIQGLYSKAESLYIEAKSIRSQVLGKTHPKHATVCNNLAYLYETQGLYSKAKPLYLEAKNILARALGKKHPDYAVSCNNLANLHNAQRQYSKAESLHLEAKKIHKQVLGKKHPAYAISCNNLALLYVAQGFYSKAEFLYIEAKNILGKNHPSYATFCLNLAMLYQTQKKYSKTLAFYEKAFANLQQQLKQNLAYASEKNRQRFLQANINRNFKAFHSFASDYIDSLGIAKSKKVLTQWYNNQLLTKSLLFQSSQKTRERIYASKDDSLIDQYEQFVAQRVQRNKVLELTMSERKKRGVNLDSLNNHVNDLEQALARRSTEFAKELEEYQWHKWQEVKQKLKPGEVAIEIIRFEWRHKGVANPARRETDTVRYAALIVTPQSRFPYPVFLRNGNFMEGKAYTHYRLTNIKQKAKDNASYRHFWQPIQQKLKEIYPGVRKVFVSLDGVYHQINLETLRNPGTGKYLDEELDIRLVSTTKDLLSRDKNPTKVAPNKKVRLFGFPAYAVWEKANQKISEETQNRKLRDLFKGGKVPPLPGTKKEVQHIGQLLRQKGIAHQIYLGQAASEVRIKALKYPRVLHLATHGYFLQDKDLARFKKQRQLYIAGTDLKQYVENPLLRSGLLWTGAQATINKKNRPKNSENGILTAREVLNMDLDSTQLVVLSACETGRGEIQNGEGVYGLQRAFLSAGAKYVLMSLWKVDDVATQFFMQYFYESWSKDQNVRRAYRFAQDKLRKDYPSPYYWGAFVLVQR